MNVGKGRGWRSLTLWAVLLVAISGVSLVHIAGGPSRFIEEVSRLDEAALYALGILLLAEMVRAVRLQVLARSYSISVPFHWALTARLVGRFFGILTPAYSGSTPARSAVISWVSGKEIGASFAVATMESIFDAMLPVAITLFLTIPLLPATWLPFLVSLFIALLWIGGIGWARTDRFEEFLRRRLRSERLLCYILKQRTEFFQVLRRTTRPRFVFAGTALTILAHIVETFSVIVLALGASGNSIPILSISVGEVFRSFLALEASHVMVMSPTPGGAGLFEFGLTGILTPEVIVWWRIVFILFSLAPGLLLLALFSSIRRHLRETVERGIGGCDLEEA